MCSPVFLQNTGGIYDIEKNGRKSDKVGGGRISADDFGWEVKPRLQYGTSVRLN